MTRVDLCIIKSKLSKQHPNTSVKMFIVNFSSRKILRVEAFVVTDIDSILFVDMSSCLETMLSF